MASLTEDQAEKAWQRVRNLSLLERVDEGAVLRAALLPSQIAPFLQFVESIMKARELPIEIDARPALGTARCRIVDRVPGDRFAALVAELRGRAQHLGGGLLVEACPTSAKSGIDVWGDGRQDARLMAGAKAALDARATMSPGRFLGGL